MRLAQSMRGDWDQRARKDTYFYIASWKRDWDDETFFRSGEEDYQRLVDPVLTQLGFATDGKRMLELGCGAGRMTRSFARRFGHVIASDVSPEMLDRGRRLNPQLTRVHWVLGNGTDLSAVSTASVDFVFSYLVLQHLPAERLILQYVAEMMRVLAADGLCVFQLNGTDDQQMNWRGRATWGTINLLWTLRARGMGRWMADRLGLDPQMAGKTWHGVSIRMDRIVAAIHDNGGSVLQHRGEHTPMAWYCAKKHSGREEIGAP